MGMEARSFAWNTTSIETWVLSHRKVFCTCIEWSGTWKLKKWGWHGNIINLHMHIIIIRVVKLITNKHSIWDGFLMSYPAKSSFDPLWQRISLKITWLYVWEITYNWNKPNKIKYFVPVVKKHHAAACKYQQNHWKFTWTLHEATISLKPLVFCTKN